MTILILLALFVLFVAFAVFFVLFKLGWLIFRNHSNKGPAITAAICTFLLAGIIGLGAWMGVRAVLSPFQGLMARVKQNPAPVYGERIYKDSSFPFELTVYDGMDFSDWIHWKEMDLKVGIDTNAFKKDASGKKPQSFLMAGILRQTNIQDTNPLEEFQAGLQTAQTQHRVSITSSNFAEINGMPAYQAQGEAYSNRGLVYFWLTAVQTSPNTVYYIGALSAQYTETLQNQAIQMVQSFRLTPPVGN